jgi:hypothetical protein
MLQRSGAGSYILPDQSVAAPLLERRWVSALLVVGGQSTADSKRAMHVPREKCIQLNDLKFYGSIGASPRSDAFLRFGGKYLIHRG